MVIDHVSESWDDPPSTHHTSQESHKISVILILLETESNTPKADRPVNSSRTTPEKKLVSITLELRLFDVWKKNQNIFYKTGGP